MFLVVVYVLCAFVLFVIPFVLFVQLSAEDADVPGQMCVFGKCHYCKESEPVCANADNQLEGVVLQLIPGSFSKYRSPWQRTYKDLVKAEWETNMDYCQ